MSWKELLDTQKVEYKLVGHEALGGLLKKIARIAGALLCCVDMSRAQNKTEFPALAIAGS